MPPAAAPSLPFVVSVASYFPHFVCLRGDVALISWSVITDVLIGLAYYAIPFVIFHLRKAGRLTLDSELETIWESLQWFILACGTGHMVDAANVWQAAYWIKVGVNVLTVLTSIRAAWVFQKHGVRFAKLIRVRKDLAANLRSLHEEFRAAAQHT